MTANKRLSRLLRQYEKCRITKEELRKYLESGVLGRVTGIIGPFVVRYQGDKLVISDRALDYHKSMSELSVEGRNNFAAKVRFAQFLNNNNDIKHIWTIAGINGRSAWNRLIKYNPVKGNYPTTENIITPSKYHFSNVLKCSLTSDFRVKYNLRLSENEKSILILVPYQPICGTDKPFEIFRIEGSGLNQSQISICRRYKRYIIYSAILKGDEWSNTTAQDGAFETQKLKCEEDSILCWLMYIRHYQNTKYRKEIQRTRILKGAPG